DRRWLLAGCILAWSAATAACGFARDSTELLFAAVGVAIGEAVLTPLIYSMIPDLFPGERRTLANLVYFGASLVGAGLGLALSGALVGLLPEGPIRPWRLAFLVAAAPAPLLALGVAMIGRVPHGPVADTVRATGLAGFVKSRGVLL